MKYAATFALFLIFAVSLFGVKYLESYTAHYEQCATHWMDAVQATELYAGERDVLMQKLEQGERPIVNGEPCPKLLDKHKDLIALRLKLKS